MAHMCICKRMNAANHNSIKWALAWKTCDLNNRWLAAVNMDQILTFAAKMEKKKLWILFWFERRRRRNSTNVWKVHWKTRGYEPATAIPICALSLDGNYVRITDHWHIHQVGDTNRSVVMAACVENDPLISVYRLAIDSYVVYQLA